MADRPEMFGPTRGFSRMADSMQTNMQNVVGPTLVAMATKLGLGAEIQSLNGLFICVFVRVSYSVSRIFFLNL